MTNTGNYTAEEFSRRVAVFEAASEGLSKICGVIGRWGSAQDMQLVVDAAMALHKAGTSVESGLVAYSRLRVYPAALLFQAYTLGLVRAKNWEELHGFLATELVNERGSADSILTALFPIYWQGHMRDNWKDVEGLENLINPMTEKLFALFGPWSSAFCTPQIDFEKVFILTEFIPALMFLNGIEKADLAAKVSEGSGRSGDFHFMPVGRTGRGFGFDDGEFNWMSANSLRDGLVKAGFCKGDSEFYDLALKNYALAARRSPPVSGKLSAALLFLYFSGGRDRTMIWDTHRNARRLC